MPSSSAYAGTAANVTGIGSVAWTSTTNAQGAPNFSGAQANLPGGSSSNWLQATNYGFSVPTTAIITGVGSAITRSAFAANTRDNSLKLVKGGTISGNDKASATAYPIISLGTATYGGDGELWGLTLTPADVNASNFGQALSSICTSGFSGAIVDAMQLTIYYTDGGVSGSQTRFFNFF